MVLKGAESGLKNSCFQRHQKFKGAELSCIFGFSDLADVMFFPRCFQLLPGELNLFGAIGIKPQI
jgi:hypothetical protein